MFMKEEEIMPTALITGASSEVGISISNVLASNDINIIIQ